MHCYRPYTLFYSEYCATGRIFYLFSSADAHLFPALERLCVPDKLGENSENNEALYPAFYTVKGFMQNLCLTQRNREDG